MFRPPLDVKTLWFWFSASAGFTYSVCGEVTTVPIQSPYWQRVRTCTSSSCLRFQRHNRINQQVWRLKPSWGCTHLLSVFPSLTNVASGSFHLNPVTLFSLMCAFPVTVADCNSDISAPVSQTKLSPCPSPLCIVLLHDSGGTIQPHPWDFDNEFPGKKDIW